ncbi:MAG: hypothetical protein U0X76_01315 [Bacteroidia bacterium]
MSRSTRRYLLIILFLAGLILKKNGFGICVFLLFPAAVFISVEMLRSAVSIQEKYRMQVFIYIAFSFYLLLTVAQLQYWIPPAENALFFWLTWIGFSILFFLKARKGNLQLITWAFISFLLSAAAWMNPRTYHNFFRYSRYEEYVRHRFSETEQPAADFLIDKYKTVNKIKSEEAALKAKELEKSKADDDDILRQYNIAIDYDPDNASVIYDRAMYKLHHLELSAELAWNMIKDFDRVIKLNQRFVDAYFHRGIMLSYVNSKSRAIKDFRMAALLNPGTDYSMWIKKIQKGQ